MNYNELHFLPFPLSRNLRFASISYVGNYVKVAGINVIKDNDFNLNIPLYVEKIIEDDLPSVEEAMADLKKAWEESLKAEEKFKNILKNYI